MPSRCRASLLLFILFGRPEGVPDGYLGSSCCTSSGISRLGWLLGGDAFRGGRLADRRCLGGGFLSGGRNCGGSGGGFGNLAFLSVAHFLDQRRQLGNTLGQLVDVFLGRHAEA